jgi:hypothetical protein
MRMTLLKDWTRRHRTLAYPWIQCCSFDMYDFAFLSVTWQDISCHFLSKIMICQPPWQIDKYLFLDVKFFVVFLSKKRGDKNRLLLPIANLQASGINQSKFSKTKIIVVIAVMAVVGKFFQILSNKNRFFLFLLDFFLSKSIKCQRKTRIYALFQKK